MNYSTELEEILKVKEFIDDIEKSFDKREYSKNFRTPLNLLRSLKLFLYRNWNECRQISKGTILDSPDCLTLATIVNLLAARKGVQTKIVRPKDITRYFHAMLSYQIVSEDKSREEIFKVAGRYRKYECVPMTAKQVEKRIRYIIPLVNLVNYCRTDIDKNIYKSNDAAVLEDNVVLLKTV